MLTPRGRALFFPVIIIALAATSCSDNNGSSGGDGGVDAGHDLNTLTVKGKVTIGIGSPATGVKIIARCGSKKPNVTTSDDKGVYSFTADVKGCAPLVVEFNKESYLPNFRVIKLPPPTSPITLDVPLSALEKLQCGTVRCKVQNNPLWNLPNKPMKQGWVVSASGTSALDYIPGELRQTDGKLAALMGFSFFDFRDQKGAVIGKFNAADVIDLCVPIPTSSLDWIGDVNAATADAVELNWYNLQPVQGLWKPRTKPAKVAYTKGYKFTKDSSGNCKQVTDAEGMPVRNIVDAKRSELADVRSNQVYYTDECLGGVKSQVNEFWVCGQVDGSGWYAWGLGVTERSCFALSVTDQCKAPLSNVVFTVKGRDHGYRAQAWTNAQGQACLDVIPSEPTGKDYDHDKLGGETYWVDVVLSYDKVLQNTTKSHQNPKYTGKATTTCAQRTNCTPLKKTMQDWNKGTCN